MFRQTVLQKKKNGNESSSSGPRSSSISDMSMGNEDVDAQSVSTLTNMALGSSPMISSRGITAADILLSRGSIGNKVTLISSSLRSKNNDSKKSMKQMTDIKDGNFVYPEEKLQYDTTQLTRKEIETLENAACGIMSSSMDEEETVWRNGHTPNILSDIPGTELWSGFVLQQRPNDSSYIDEIPKVVVGSKVIRGPDWKWRDQDGGEGSIGVVESIMPWSGIEGEGMSVRWSNDSLYTYRWGADGKFDVIPVEVDDDTEKITKKYNPPQYKKGDLGSNESDYKLGILVHIYEKEHLSDHVIKIGGLIEYPDFNGALSRIVGEKNTKDKTIWFQEIVLVRGFQNMGWTIRFGRETWQPGTKYQLKIDNFDEKDEGNIKKMVGHFEHNIIVKGVNRKVSGDISISTDQLFTMDHLNHHTSLKVSDDGLSVTCISGESRNLALATVGFTSGVHYWELKIEQAEFGSVFLGVCEKAGPPDSPASSATRLNRWHGWGFVNFRATYHNSTERIYGDHFNSGDTIGVLLDMDEGKIAFFMDGIKYGEHIVADLGVAFGNVHGKRGLRKTLFPCIGMRKSGDRISLTNKWISKPLLSHSFVLQEAIESSFFLRSWSTAFQFQKPLHLSPKILRESWYEWKRWSEGNWKRYPIRPKGIIVDFDTSISTCSNISEKAGLVAPFLAGDRVRISTSGGRELDQAEEALVVGAYRGHLWYRTETQGNEGAEEGRVWAWYWTKEELIGLVLIRRGGKDMTLLENSASDIDDKRQLSNGFNNPEEKLAFNSFDDFVRLVNETAWTCEKDMLLCEAVNVLCDTLGLDAHNLPFTDISSSDEEIQKNIDSKGTTLTGRSRTRSIVSRNYLSDSALENFSGPQIRARCAVLRILNSKIRRSLFLIRLNSSSDKESLITIDSSTSVYDKKSTSSTFHNNYESSKLGFSIGAWLRSVRRILFTSTKRIFWDDLIKATTTNTPLPSDEYEDPREIRSIRINRIQAQPSKLSLLPLPSDRLRRSVFGQLYREMRTWSDNQFRRAYCGKGHGGQKRAFKVKFLGEGVNDYGGPYRAVFEQVVDELQMDNIELTKGEQGLLPLLVPCPNRRSGTGSNQDKFMLNPSCGNTSVANGPMALELYRFLGKLIGTAVRHGLQMGLDLPALIWHPLASLPLSSVNLESIDVATSNLLRQISQIAENTPDREERLDYLSFTTHLSDGTEVELIPNGEQKKVLWKNRMEYIDFVKRKRLTESVQQLQALQDGLASVLPMEVASLFTPQELEVLICGRRQVDVQLLKQCTDYDEVDENTPHVQYFWEVLSEMTNEERTSFLRFVWARSRMPNSAKDFPMNFKIQAAHDEGARKDPDKYLPHAQTCFFSLSLPAYTKKEILREKLLFAIENSPNMDADVRLHNAEGWADA